MERLFDTEAASRWLNDHGVKRSPRYLRKLRTVGDGPSYHHLNGRVYYTEPGLEEHIVSRLSPPRRSSSEPDQAARTVRSGIARGARDGRRGA